MRIFYLITEFDIGGAERCLWELARRMKRRGHDVLACALSGRGPVGDWLARENIEVRHLNLDNAACLPAIARLPGLLRRWKPDVLHTFLFHANLVGRLAGALVGVPVSAAYSC